MSYTTKTCTSCGVTKTLRNFHRHAGASTHPRCKACRSRDYAASKAGVTNHALLAAPPRRRLSNADILARVREHDAPAAAAWVEEVVP